MLKVQTLPRTYSYPSGSRHNLQACIVSDLTIDCMNMTSATITLTTSTTSTLDCNDCNDLFGAAALARVCYSAAARWAFRKAPLPPSPLISIPAAFPRTPRVARSKRGPSSYAFASPPPRYQAVFESAVEGDDIVRACTAKDQDSWASALPQVCPAFPAGLTSHSVPFSADSPAAESDASGCCSDDKVPASAASAPWWSGLAPLLPLAPEFPTGRLSPRKPANVVSMKDLRRQALKSGSAVKFATKIGKSEQFLFALKGGPGAYCRGTKDTVIREETENSWQTGLVWKSGVRLQSRVWHSVTEENLEDFDILRDAKPEKLSRESVARGKMTKEIPTVIDSDIYYRSAKVEFPVMQVAHARALDHYTDRYRVGKSSKRWAYLWRLVQELVRPKKRK
ncbi:hypothetical protein MIR68_009915 [Amoeboaphelidium protococcarum]|nr:hypothetical protein MIR68_009915 [Amoeboaphelidium protococcarum]